jgi:hypothetical protein
MLAAVAFGAADSRAVSAATSAANTLTISGDNTAFFTRSINAALVSLALASAFMVQPVPREFRGLLQPSLRPLASVTLPPQMPQRN